MKQSQVHMKTTEVLDFEVMTYSNLNLHVVCQLFKMTALHFNGSFCLSDLYANSEPLQNVIRDAKFT